jgi:hypothetical protein
MGRPVSDRSPETCCEPRRGDPGTEETNAASLDVAARDNRCRCLSNVGLQRKRRDMTELPTCLLVVTAEIDTAVEAEWNRWYDEIHLPEALACPGVIRGARYLGARDASLTDHGTRSSDAAKVYAAVYELAGPEAMETPEFQEMRGWYQFTDRIRARTQVFLRLQA